MINRIIIIDKPEGMTSQTVVNKVKKILNVKKAGHIGTLDPLATGVLPILLDETTKFSKYLIEHDKTYVATIKLGEQSRTGDREGDIIKKEEVDKSIFNEEKIKEVLDSFLGLSKQIPSIYSAIKINGKKLYEYARENESVNIPSREIFIKSIKLLNINENEETITYEVEVSKGTYIRTLCEDIANKLGTIGYMISLRRTEVDKFNENKSVTLKNLEDNKNKDLFKEKIFIKPEDVFDNLNKLELNDRKLELYLNGVKLTFEVEDGIYNIYDKSNRYVGIGVVKDKLLKRDIVLSE